jgi:hypothetical protein
VLDLSLRGHPQRHAPSRRFGIKGICNSRKHFVHHALDAGPLWVAGARGGHADDPGVGGDKERRLVLVSNPRTILPVGRRPAR